MSSRRRLTGGHVLMMLFVLPVVIPVSLAWQMVKLTWMLLKGIGLVTFWTGAFLVYVSALLFRLIFVTEDENHTATYVP